MIPYWQCWEEDFEDNYKCLLDFLDLVILKWALDNFLAAQFDNQAEKQQELQIELELKQIGRIELELEQVELKIEQIGQFGLGLEQVELRIEKIGQFGLGLEQLGMGFKQI